METAWLAGNAIKLRRNRLMYNTLRINSLFLNLMALGLQDGVEFALLTDFIYQTWADKTAKEYKKFKGLKKENLRDNMTNKELVLNMLAELSSKEISETINLHHFLSMKTWHIVAEIVPSHLMQKAFVLLNRKVLVTKNKIQNS